MGVVDYGMNIQEAVDAPRFHNQWLPDVLNVEQWFARYGAGAAEDGIQREISGCATANRFLPIGATRSALLSIPRAGERLGASDYRSKRKGPGVLGNAGTRIRGTRIRILGR